MYLRASYLYNISIFIADLIACICTCLRIRHIDVDVAWLRSPLQDRGGSASGQLGGAAVSAGGPSKIWQAEP